MSQAAPPAEQEEVLPPLSSRNNRGPPMQATAEPTSTGGYNQTASTEAPEELGDATLPPVSPGRPTTRGKQQEREEAASASSARMWPDPSQPEAPPNPVGQ